MGVTVQPWRDSADPELDRAPVAGSPPRRHLSLVRGSEVTIHLIPDGETGPPLDADLDGRPFDGWWLEAPFHWPELRPVAGRSSIVRFTPWATGHYTLMVYRPDGGGAILHFDLMS
jgi:hypothetical protein